MIDEILKILIWGTLIGGCYSLLALGLTLLYGVARVVNLAHGSIFMLGVFTYYAFSFRYLTLDPWLALATAIIFTGLLGVILYRTTIHPILGDEVATLVITITLAILIQNLVVILFGSAKVPLINPMGEKFFNFLGVTVSFTSAVSFFLSISLLFVVALFVNKSKIGKSMRAVSQDREAAMLMGVNVNRLLVFVAFLSAMLAAIAGFMYAISSLGYFGYAVYYMWFAPLTSSFAIVILGGLGSVKGSFLGSFVVSYSQQIVAVFVPQGGGIISLAALVVMVAILLIRPKGFFGKRVEMEE